MNWSLDDIAKASKPNGVAQERMKHPAPSPVPPASIGGRGGQEIKSVESTALPTPAYADPVTNSATWLFDGGRTSLSLARPHGRQRMAICGAPDEALVAVVVGAIEKYFTTKAELTESALIA